MNNTKHPATGRFWVKFFRGKNKKKKPAGAEIPWPA